jgi:hypothetical protein
MLSPTHRPAQMTAMCDMRQPRCKGVSAAWYKLLDVSQEHEP